jgi:hypothetical protein
MRKPRTQRAAAWVTFAALVCLAAALLEESFIHTDDGCAVEIHCLACRLVAGSTVVVEAAGIPPVVPVPAGDVVLETIVVVAQARPVLTPSRAPPLG